MNFSSTLLRWYKKHKRDLPWRKTKDPYIIWLSEIILQQTRVNQGLPYFLKFVKKYPTVKRFADAALQDILKLWQGLGYYSRARNMHQTANNIVNHYDGKFPNHFNDLLKLKGVGEYTASAISSIAFNKPFPVVDGNVVRVLSRYFGIKDSYYALTSKKKFTKKARELMGKYPPSEFNQAMMEFGALQCVPKKPACIICPLNKTCYAKTNNAIDKLPKQIDRPKIRQRYFDYLVLHHKKKIYLQKRIEDDIWKNLFDFPAIESKKFKSENSFKKSNILNAIFPNCNLAIQSVSKVYHHKLSHQQLHARFWSVQILNKNSSTSFKDLILADEKALKIFPFPKLIERYMDSHNIFNNQIVM